MTALLALLAAASLATGLPGQPPAAPVTPPSGSAGGDAGGASAERLVTMCKSTSPGLISGCYAYIAGVVDTVRAYQVWLGQREFCPPASLAQADLRQVFLGYMLAYPDRMKGQAASVVVVALKDAFPCAGAPPLPGAGSRP